MCDVIGQTLLVLVNLPVFILAVYSIYSGAFLKALRSSKFYGVFIFFTLSSVAPYSLFVVTLNLPSYWYYILYWHIQELVAYTSIYSRTYPFQTILKFDCRVAIVLFPIWVSVLWMIASAITITFFPGWGNYLLASIPFCPVFILEALITYLTIIHLPIIPFIMLPILFLGVMYFICKSSARDFNNKLVFEDKEDKNDSV